MSPSEASAETKVCQLDVTLMVQQHVVQLQVTIDDPALVKIVERQTNLRAVETCVLLGQSALALKRDSRIYFCF